MAITTSRSAQERSVQTGNKSVTRVTGGIRLVAVAALAIGALAMASPAVAQERVVQEADRTVYRKTTVIDFTGVTLEGELKKPEGTVFLNRGRTSFNSLIKLRGDFQQELDKSVETL